MITPSYRAGPFNLNTDRGSQKEASTVSAANAQTNATTTKLDKLCEKFLNEKIETPAFKDTFFDKEIFIGIKGSRNYQHLCEQLLTYILHSSNKTDQEQKEEE
jgi:hypothetical protein